jgi:PAS domain S-box-containing protein
MNESNEFSLRLNAIIEAAIDGIITINSKGIMESVSQAVVDLFQYAREEMIGKNVSMLMPEPDHSYHDRYINRYLNTKKAKIIGIGREVKGRKKDGTVFPFRLAVSQVVLNDRIIFTGIIHDLTAVKNAQNDLQRLNHRLEEKISERTDELESAINRLIKTNRKLEKSENALTKALESERETNQLKTQFITTASHEFRTPLSTILSSASLISKYEEKDQQSKRLRHVDKIKNSVNHLIGILNDFLDLSKLEEGKVTLNPEHIALEEIIKTTFSELQGMLKPGQKLRLVSDEEVMIHCDKKTLKNILFNLLSNAIKYSDEGLIQVILTNQNNKISIAIKDEGYGIPEADQKYLFERFFRASNAGNIQGTGLGLSIVKRYVNLLGGSIEVESQENTGTTFTIEIPYSL